MIQLQRALAPALAIGCLVAVYAILLGFGVEASVSPVLGQPGPAPAVHAATLEDAQAEAGSTTVEPVAATTDFLARSRFDSRSPVKTSDAAEQLLAYLGLSRAIEQQLQQEFPGLGPNLTPVAQAIVDESMTNEVDPWLTYAVVKLESRFDIAAVGGAGEIGLMQVLPSTGRMVAQRALKIKDYRPAMLYEPQFNIRVGTTHLGYLLRVYDGDLSDALTAYNTGSAEAQQRHYAKQVMVYYSEYQDLDSARRAQIAAFFPK